MVKLLMPPERLNRREFLKLAIPASLLTNGKPTEDSPTLEVMQPEQYTQQEFNNVAAIGISAALEGLGNVNRRLSALENRFPPPHITTPQDSHGNL